MFRTFVKVRHASVLADPYPLCYDSSTNTNPRLSIRCWSGGCCFISLCSAICGVSAISRKSAMSRPLVFCSSVALSSKILLTRTCLHIDCSNGSLLFHLSVAPRSGTKTTSTATFTCTSPALYIYLYHICTNHLYCCSCSYCSYHLYLMSYCIYHIYLYLYNHLHILCTLLLCTSG